MNLGCWWKYKILIPGMQWTTCRWCSAASNEVWPEGCKRRRFWSSKLPDFRPISQLLFPVCPSRLFGSVSATDSSIETWRRDDAFHRDVFRRVGDVVSDWSSDLVYQKPKTRNNILIQVNRSRYLYQWNTGKWSNVYSLSLSLDFKDQLKMMLQNVNEVNRERTLIAARSSVHDSSR